MNFFHRNDKAFFLKVALLTVIIFESNGILTRAIGINGVIGSWVYAFLMVSFTGIALFTLFLIKGGKETRVFFYPLVLFSIFIFVSFLSSLFIFPKPLKDWLPSLYKFTPLFIFYFLYVFRYTSREIVIGIITVSVLASLLLLFDHFMPLEFLNSYMRRSAFFSLEGRRIVILKNEVIFGFVALMSFLIASEKNIFKNKIYIAIAMFLFFIQAFIMESRMGFLAMGVATIVLLYLKGITRKTLQLLIAGLLVIIFVFPIVFNKHIESLNNMSMHDSESNISIRFETVSHFYDLYKETYGLGIGMMSPNSTNDNVLHMVEHYNILDAGAFSSLFQFGPLGLLAWIFLTVYCLKTYIKYYNHTGKSDPYSASAFAFILAFTLSPLPISFFTATWCISMGGLFLYLMWLYQSQMMMHKNPRACK